MEIVAWLSIEKTRAVVRALEQINGKEYMREYTRCLPRMSEMSRASGVPHRRCSRRSQYLGSDGEMAQRCLELIVVHSAGTRRNLAVGSGWGRLFSLLDRAPRPSTS